ncbi:hypothetical protein FHX37_3836 [Haloactinospora alba]|uniref:CU044_5270 family protein n=1 Tax=Haloactinospora alba TaxID=405555 RepID=A0A543N9K6_9ACTN|nr:CU044_5270 family protein [Haloactinospora alba]TQN28491.1 hypothetical protein FHX37_3836 [Haloactinospora alba]
MDELRLLRDMDADTPPMDAEARFTARNRLSRAITGQERGRWSRLLPRRTAPRLAIASAALAVVAGGALVAVEASGDPAAPPDTSGTGTEATTASAKQALRDAADQARKDREHVPVPDRDQYIYTKEILEETPVGGGEIRTFTEENWDAVDPHANPSKVSERGDPRMIEPLPEESGRFPPVDYRKLAELPTDPGELLRDPDITALKPDGAELTADDYDMAYTNLIYLLHGWQVMPEDLRGAAFDALALVPDVTFQEGTVDARGRTGVGITREGGGTFPTPDIVLDAETHEYLGMRDTSTVEVDGEEQEVQQVSSLVDYGVVDSIDERP